MIPANDLEWTRDLDHLLELAASEAVLHDAPALASALNELRLSRSYFAGAVLASLESVGARTLTATQYEQMQRMLVRDAAAAAVEEAQRAAEARRSAGWRDLATRVGMVVALGTLLLAVLGTCSTWLGVPGHQLP